MQHNFVPSQHKGGQFIKDKKLSLSWKYISSTLICLKTGLMKLVTRILIMYFVYMKLKLGRKLTLKIYTADDTLLYIMTTL